MKTSIKNAYAVVKKAIKQHPSAVASLAGVTLAGAGIVASKDRSFAVQFMTGAVVTGCALAIDYCISEAMKASVSEMVEPVNSDKTTVETREVSEEDVPAHIRAMVQ